jgi:hypothetical protein
MNIDPLYLYISWFGCGFIAAVMFLGILDGGPVKLFPLGMFFLTLFAFPLEMGKGEIPSFIMYPLVWFMAAIVISCGPFILIMAIICQVLCRMHQSIQEKNTLKQIQKQPVQFSVVK